MDISLLKYGIFITVLGMGTVYFFIIMLILTMQITEKVLKILGKYFPEKVAEVKPTKKRAGDNYEEIAVAIASAIRQR